MANRLGEIAFDEEMEFLYSPGSYLSYDLRAKRIAAAIPQILQAADVSFGIFGKKESCCGESIRKTGGVRDGRWPRVELTNVKILMITFDKTAMEEAVSQKEAGVVTKWWRFASLSPVADHFQAGPRIERSPVGSQAIAQESVDTGEPARMETS
jgi:hypothetical protein